MNNVQKFYCLLVTCCLLLVMGNTATAQDPAACPAGVGCPQIALSPDTLRGDFFLGETLLVPGQQNPLLQVPPGKAHKITIRNIQDTNPDFGKLFVYDDATVTVNVPDGKVRPYTAKPRKKFIRGTINFTCAINNVREGENAACAVTLDGAPQPQVELNQSASFILDPGSHTVQVQVVGAHADLWAPGTWQQVVRLRAGQTAKVRSKLDKRAKLMLTLNQPNVVGDFFINGEQVATQVASFERFVAPGQRYKLEVKNITDPAAGGAYSWLDATSNASPRPSQELTVQFKLKKKVVPTPKPPQAGKEFITPKGTLTVSKTKTAASYPENCSAFTGATCYRANPGFVLMYVYFRAGRGTSLEDIHNDIRGGAWSQVSLVTEDGTFRATPSIMSRVSGTGVNDLILIFGVPEGARRFQLFWPGNEKPINVVRR